MEDAIRQSESFNAAGLGLVAASDSTPLWTVGKNATAGQKQKWEATCQRLVRYIQQSGGPYIAGPDVSLADLVLWPFMERVLLCAREFSGYNATLGSPELGDWVESMHSRESVQWAAADQRAFVRVLCDQSNLGWFDFVHSGAVDLHSQLGPALKTAR
jgi:glutathione S-transferase